MKLALHNIDFTLRRVTYSVTTDDGLKTLVGPAVAPFPKDASIATIRQAAIIAARLVGADIRKRSQDTANALNLIETEPLT